MQGRFLSKDKGVVYKRIGLVSANQKFDNLILTLLLLFPCLRVEKIKPTASSIGRDVLEIDYFEVGSSIGKNNEGTEILR